MLDGIAGVDLLDLSSEVGAFDEDAPVFDVKDLLKAKARYRRFQRQGGKSTP